MNTETRFKSLLILLLTVAGLSGCSSHGVHTADHRPVRFEDLMTVFEKGEARLTCGRSCAGTWGWNRPDMQSMYRYGVWKDLAFKVMEIGYQFDLAYLYMARSAEELGYPDGARVYYRLARDTVNKCATTGYCDGVNVPMEARFGLERLQ